MDTKRNSLANKDFECPARNLGASGHEDANRLCVLRPVVSQNASGHKNTLFSRGLSVVSMRPDKIQR